MAVPNVEKKKSPLSFERGLFYTYAVVSRLVAACIDGFVFTNCVQIEGAFLWVVAAGAESVVQVKVTISGLHTVLLCDLEADGLDGAAAAGHAVVFGDEVAVRPDFRRHDGFHLEQRNKFAFIVLFQDTNQFRSRQSLGPFGSLRMATFIDLLVFWT